MKLNVWIATIVMGCAVLLVSQETQAPHVGPLPDGGFRLNNNWTLRPAGQQIDVDTLPMRSAFSKNGKFMLVLNGGYNPPSVSVIDIASRKELGRTRVTDAWEGLSFAPTGTSVYVGGGSQAKVYEFSFNPETGSLTPSRELSTVTDPANPGKSFIGDVVVSADGRLLYAADVMENQIAVINLQSGKLIERWKTGRRPYRILLSPDGKSFYVSNWADSSVVRQDALSGDQISMVRTGPHPTDLVWLNKPAPTDETNESAYASRLFVAAANTNSVFSFGVTNDGDLRPMEIINLSLTPFQPLGMTPAALSLDADGKHLYVACSDINAIAVVDITTARSHVLGFVPTGWYPTGVSALSDGSLAIINGRGRGSDPNSRGPNPQRGTVQFVPGVNPDQLEEFTKTVIANSPYRSDEQRTRYSGGNVEVFAGSPGHPSPIQHVIYIIKENRTYDQVLGDMPEGNGDKSLTIFGENVTPNQHKLAREFVLFDNFYVNANTSAEGHNWASAAIAPDYTVKLSPNSDAKRRSAYDYEGGEPANTPPAGYIWNNALSAGLSLRTYGIWSTNVPLEKVENGRQIASVKDPALRPYADLNFRGFDLNYSDIDRSKEFIKEWSEFSQKGQAPQLVVMRLGNDYTFGTTPGKLSPVALIAQNDQAVGMLVQAISQSPFWSSTAIFIVEAAAAGGADHVDSHRSTAYVISPYTRRGLVDSSMYNQTSILRTIEAVFDLRPMTLFDAASPVMFGCFSTKPDTTPYTLVPPRVSLTEQNSTSRL